MATKNPFKLVKEMFSSYFYQPPVGNVLAGATTATVQNVHVPTQKEIQATEPFGSMPKRKLSRDTGFTQRQNLSTTLDIDKVQNAFRQAERGEVGILFTYYRDVFLGSGPVASEWSKRKLAVLSEPYSIIPFEKGNKDDELAAKAIEDMIKGFPRWNEALTHLMNAVLYPIAAIEKNFNPWNPKRPNPLNCRFELKALLPVSYELVTYRLPYLPSGPLNAMPYAYTPAPPIMNNYNANRPSATVYNPDSWEPDLRFYTVLDNGIIIRDIAQLVEPDPVRHMIYRCNLLNGLARENFGGLGKAVLWWAILANMSREQFSRLMDRYGVPFTVVHADTSQTDTVQALQQAMELSQKLGGLIIDKDVMVDLAEINMSGAAEAQEKWIQLCNDQIALLISGQTLSSHAKSTGLGSGTANLQAQVRSDIIRYDRQMLGCVLRDQLFAQYLEYNGFTGRPPTITWGQSDINDTKLMSETLMNLANAGLQIADSDVEIISQKLGFQIVKTNVPTKEESDKEDDSKKESELVEA